jgi:hypothetical protein
LGGGSFSTLIVLTCMSLNAAKIAFNVHDATKNMNNIYSNFNTKSFCISSKFPPRKRRARKTAQSENYSSQSRKFPAEIIFFLLSINQLQFSQSHVGSQN